MDRKAGGGMKVGPDSERTGGETRGLMGFGGELGELGWGRRGEDWEAAEGAYGDGRGVRREWDGHRRLLIAVVFAPIPLFFFGFFLVLLGLIGQHISYLA